MSEKIEDIVREMRKMGENYSKSESNDCRYVAYWLGTTFADRIEAAVKALEADRDNWRKQALDGDARANATREDLSQVGNDTMNINRINNYNDMVDAWNNYVRTRHGMLDGFFVWLFDKAKGEEQ